MSALPQIDAGIIHDFFFNLYGEDAPGYLVITVIDKHNDMVKCTSFRADAEGIEAASGHTNIMAKSKHNQLYFGLGLQGLPPPSEKRGKEETVIAIPGFAVDIDILGPGHKSKDLPTQEEAFSILESFPFKPVIIVHSGGVSRVIGHSRSHGYLTVLMSGHEPKA